MLKLSWLFRILLAQHFTLYEGEPGPGSAPPAPPAPAGAETFSREYVSELRAENKGYRLKAQEQEAKRLEAEGKATAAEAAAQVKIDAAAQASNERILRSELKTAAIKAGMVDLDGLKLADLSTVKLNDAGEIEGADALMAAMKTAKPYLFGATGTTSHTGAPPPPKPPEAVNVKDMDAAAYAAHKASVLAKK